jgi:hypothetical protein
MMRPARAAGADIKLDRHRLSLRKWTAALEFDVQYVGSTVSEHPNYTGTTVVDSWYR